jgi:Trk K+ transport system NAD-binding subunit
MKIAFICGSLEPGRDGVGDYTRRLAGELVKQQHEVLVIAFNDRQIKDTLKAVQYTDAVLMY